MSDLVCVGQIGGAYGVHGDVRLRSFCQQPEAIAAYAPLVTEDGRSFELRLGNELKDGFAATLSGVSTKEDADALRGVRLYAPRDRLPKPDEGEFYHADLIGLEVRDLTGAIVGKVKAVQEQGAGELLEITRKGQSETVFIPFTLAFVPTVDLENGQLIIDPPDGLID